MKALEVIVYGAHKELLSDEMKEASSWESKVRTEASGLLTAITSFSWILCFMAVYQLLFHLADVTVKLRGSSIEISVSYREMNGIKEVYKELRENDEDPFEPIYNQAVLLARAVNTEPSIPHIAQRMSHRANAIASTPEEYYRRNMFIQFLDHIRCELDTRFSAPSVKIMQALSLIP